MAILPNQVCERCESKDRYDVPAEHELDSWGYGSGGGGFVCDNCLQALGEAQDENKLADYWGGSTPYTLQEQYDAAAKVKREQR